jgi:SAM-dependent methyltransferase
MSGVLGGRVGYQILRRLTKSSVTAGWCDGSAYTGRSKLEVLLGTNIWSMISGRAVIDFGCGEGDTAVEMAQHGAALVIGVDIRQSALAAARIRAERAGVAGRCVFSDVPRQQADIIISVDGFEHFDHPGEVLTIMRHSLNPGGRVLAAFGPTWFHPLGGHLFSVFPWAHLIFTEAALLRWRADFKSDGATRFGEVEGGLNQMTIRRFVKLVENSGFQFERLETVPIRRLRRFTSVLPREMSTAIVRCSLVERAVRGV